MDYTFEVTQESDGGFCAECLNADIFTQGDTRDELPANVREATDTYCFDKEQPTGIHLHLSHNQVLSCASLDY